MLYTILIGLVVGAIARFIKPGADAMGWIMTIVLGIAGSFFASFVLGLLHVIPEGGAAGLIASVVGAVVLLFVYEKLVSK